MRNILITGANRGIGLGLTKRLAGGDFGTQVFMACRDLEKAEGALRQLRTDGVPTQRLRPVPINLLDPASFDHTTTLLDQEKVNLDVLINNAAINILGDGKNFDADKAEKTISCNFLNQIKLIDHLLGRQSLKPGAVIMNITSSIGSLRTIRDEPAKSRLKTASTPADLIALSKDYIAALRRGELWQSKNAICPEYSFSKLLLSLYTELLATDERVIGQGLRVAAFCPGWVRTDMGGPTASLSVAEAIEPLVKLIDAPDQWPADAQGRLFSNGKFMSIRA